MLCEERVKLKEDFSFRGASHEAVMGSRIYHQEAAFWNVLGGDSGVV
jgi:hypothetical protein